MVRPDNVDGVIAALRTAAEQDRPVVVRGAGTKLAFGPPLSDVDVVLGTTGLAGVTAHAPGDLVVTAGAGTQLRALQDALAPAGQRLALDPPSASRGATIGGVLAAGEAGPLRLRFGTGRDLLIGIEFVRADGTVAHAGGRVVKNVAGYDLGKLLCGSYGTLGVITSATFRLHPLPARQVWVCRPVSDPGQAAELTRAVLSSPVVPSAIEVDLPGALGVLLEGSVAGVAVRAAEVVRLLGPSASTVDSAPAWWGRYPFAADDVALKMAVPPANLATAITALWEAAGATVPVRGSAGSGVVHAALPGTLPVGQISDALAAVRRHGFCTVLGAPPAVHNAVDVWGPVPGLALMRRVKEQFDPRRLLSPGRFVGGI